MDNQKTRGDRSTGPGSVRSSTTAFVDLAGHYGFTPRACRPARRADQGEGRADGGVRQAPLLRAATARSRASTHMNQLAEQWLREEADPRRSRDGEGGGGGAVRAGGAAPRSAAGTSLRHVVPGERVVWLGRLRRRPRQPLQRVPTTRCGYDASPSGSRWRTGSGCYARATSWWRRTDSVRRRRGLGRRFRTTTRSSGTRR